MYLFNVMKESPNTLVPKSRFDDKFRASNKGKIQYIKNFALNSQQGPGAEDIKQEGVFDSPAVSWTSGCSPVVKAGRKRSNSGPTFSRDAPDHYVQPNQGNEQHENRA